MLFFDDNLRDPLPLGQLGRLGLPYETYKLALTEDLLAAVFGSKLTPDVRRRLDNPDVSGYLSISAWQPAFTATAQPVNTGCVRASPGSPPMPPSTFSCPSATPIRSGRSQRSI